jgi:hypothetical protein
LVVLALQVVLVVVAVMPRLATAAQVAKAVTADRAARAVADSTELVHQVKMRVLVALEPPEDWVAIQYLVMAATVVRAVTLGLAEAVDQAVSLETAATAETAHSVARVARVAVRPTAPMATAEQEAIPETVDSAATAAMETW